MAMNAPHGNGHAHYGFDVRSVLGITLTVLTIIVAVIIVFTAFRAADTYERTQSGMPFGVYPIAWGKESVDVGSQILQGGTPSNVFQLSECLINGTRVGVDTRGATASLNGVNLTQLRQFGGVCRIQLLGAYPLAYVINGGIVDDGAGGSLPAGTANTGPLQVLVATYPPRQTNATFTVNVRN